jgi:hypothetical protein
VPEKKDTITGLFKVINKGSAGHSSKSAMNNGKTCLWNSPFLLEKVGTLGFPQDYKSGGHR